MTGKPTFLAYDSETGGLVAATSSLLTAYFAVLDEELNLINELELKLKSPLGYYMVTAEALSVNKINLVEHDKSAVLYLEGTKQLWGLISPYQSEGDRLIPMGHNYSFDDGFFWQHLIPRAAWERAIRHQSVGIDTNKRARDLKKNGKLPGIQNTKLGTLVSYFGYQQAGPHTARGDTWDVINITKSMNQIS